MSGDTVMTFNSEDEANAWFAIHELEGVASKEERSELRAPGSAHCYGVPKATE